MGLDEFILARGGTRSTKKTLGGSSQLVSVS